MKEKTPMMKCGHAANATDEDNNPVCAICAGIKEGYDEIDDSVKLEGRRAHCCYGKHAFKDSSTGLPFFEYRGPNSEYDSNNPDCPKGRVKTLPGGWEFDVYYCGCYGWN